MATYPTALPSDTHPLATHPLKRAFAATLEHTLLKPTATLSEIDKICQDSLREGFRGVCVNSGWIGEVATRLQGTACLSIATIGFPLGTTSRALKVQEALEAVAAGAQEIDMVIALGLFKMGHFQAVQAEIAAVVQAAAPALVKVIIETSELNRKELTQACKLVQDAGAAFIKTSTGFSAKGAQAEDLRWIRAQVGHHLRIKASGGIRSYASALEMLAAGADTLGTSQSVQLLQALDDDDQPNPQTLSPLTQSPPKP